MSPETDLARRQASEDLVDIAALKNFTPFNRYWLRILRQKREKIRQSFENDPPAKVDAAEREVLRRLLKFCDELERTPDEHRASAEALLRSTN